ncbi:MAG: stage II sporulation protein M, partial [Candidatus Aenigmatarchaeota archaeon]
MLESLVRYKEVEKRPWIMLLWAMLITSVGVLFSVQLSYTVRVGGASMNLAGIFAVLFTIIPSVYFLTLFIRKQEKLDEADIAKHYSRGFWLRHDKDIVVFMFYFLGLTAAFAFWGFMLPADTFQLQTMKVQEIRTVSGSFTASATAGEYESFMRVLLNNLQVMGFSFVFSLLFGAGAVFIVVWNASILGVYIGRLSETLMHIPVVSMNFLPHGIPEIAAYLVAGLAGGIFSAAIIRGHKKEILTRISMDSAMLMGIAVLFVFLGAIIETMDTITRIVGIFVFYTIFIYIITIAVTPAADGKMGGCSGSGFLIGRFAHQAVRGGSCEECTSCLGRVWDARSTAQPEEHLVDAPQVQLL